MKPPSVSSFEVRRHLFLLDEGGVHSFIEFDLDSSSDYFVGFSFFFCRLAYEDA